MFTTKGTEMHKGRARVKLSFGHGPSQQQEGEEHGNEFQVLLGALLFVVVL